MYKIVRHYRKMPAKSSAHLMTKIHTMETGLTLEEAQAHCNDPETSSSTCTNNRVLGGWDWFDGYQET